MSAREEFRAAIAAAGLTPPDEIKPYSGKPERFSTNGKRSDDAGRYVFHDDERPAGWFQCLRTGVEQTWRADVKREFTPEERREWAERMRRLEAERAEAQRQAHAEAAQTAATMWKAAERRPGEEAQHPYLQRKRIPGLGARVLQDVVLVPMFHRKGELVGLQRIPADGEKRFLKGTPAAGAYMTVGKYRDDKPVVLCEGYATGVSIHLATGWFVVVAFSAGNLQPVGEKIRAALPVAQMIVAADDDAFTESGNAGLTKGREAAAAIGATITWPRWADEQVRGQGTDFNDLHCTEDLQAVRACFEDPQPPAPPPRTDCADCGATLTAEEREYYGATCERCEGAAMGRMQDEIDGDAGAAPAPTLPAAPPRAASELAAEPVDFAPEYSETDMAARHVQAMGGNALWCESWGKWLVWSGDRWVHDDTLLVRELVTRTCRTAASEILGRMDIGEAKRMTRAEKLTSYRGIASVEQLARSDRRVASRPDDWDADRWALNTPGGVVDLRTGALRPHSRGDRMTKATSVAPGGACPTWLRFLDRATGGDQQLVGFLKRMCGYSLTGEVREHAFFFVYGTGGNGKGTFLNTITSIMGDYQRVSGAEVFTEQTGDRHTTELARLHGARLVTAQETEEGKRWAEARIKALTGGDPITARYMRQDDFTFDPQFKLVIVGNHKPSFRSVDDAIKRRLHLIPFTAVIPSSEKDAALPEKLRAEASGILAWMIEGCVEWARDGLKPPAIVKQSTEQYLDAEDSLQQWLNECCIVDGTKFAASASLFASWAKWCEETGEFAGSQKRLMARLETRGVRIGQKFQGRRGCLGVGLIQPGGVDDEPC